MIKTTLRNINLAAQVIAQLTELQLPAKLSYRVGKIARAIEKENKEYLRLRLELAKRVGTSRSTTEEEKQRGQGSEIWYLANPIQEEDFADGIKEIESIEVEINVDAIALSALGEVAIPARVMQYMEDVIIDV